MRGDTTTAEKPGRLAGSYGTLLDSLIEGFQVVDFEYRYVYLNQAALVHARRSASALLGRTIMEVYPDVEQLDSFRALRRCLEQRVHSVVETEFRYPEGDVATFEVHFEPVPQGCCMLTLDIGERKRADAALRAYAERLRQAERLEAVGLLAAGVAHDFNNVIGVILAYSEAALNRASGPRREDIEGVLGAARRATELTRQLLAYGKRQAMHGEVVDPVALVRDLEGLLLRTLGSDVELSVVVSGQVGNIEVDPSQLEQVVMNLVLNARDALSAGGRIVIGLCEVEFDAIEAARHPGTQPGTHVELSVSDNGVGMDAETQARIFEPFFTTKSRGRGTGLGLSTVYGVVKQCGGDIRVSSEPGRGSTFKVYWPRCAREPASSPVELGASPTVVARPRSEPTVLIADDDALLRTLSRDCLVAAGYRVLLASSGDEALALCRSEPSLSLLVTDVVLPGTSGAALIREARTLQPKLKILCTSGHALSVLREEHGLASGTLLLAKPYFPSDLVRMVSELLSERELAS